MIADFLWRMYFLGTENKMKKRITVILLLAMLFTGLFSGLAPATCLASATKPEVSAVSAILIDQTTGTVLYEKNADKIMEPASITKVMTALLTLENLDLDKVVTIDRDMNVPGNGMNLKAGERLTVKELLYGMLVHSSNDAAEALAEQLADTSVGFNKMADQRAAGLGATHTVYKNPNGLNDVAGHVTTARDLTLICSEAMKNPTFRKIVGTAKVTIPANNVSGERTYVTTNKLLYDTKDTIVVNGQKRHPKYQGIQGVKTGETSTAGLCIVASAKRGDTQLMAVILKAPNGDSRFADAITLLDYGFNNYYSYQAVKPDTMVSEVKINGSSTIRIPATVKGGYFITLPKEASATLVSQKIQLQRNLNAPLKKGSKVGTVSFYLAGDKVGETPLVLAQTAKSGGPWTAWGIPDLWAYGVLAFIALIALVFAVRRNVRRRKRKLQEKKRRLEQIKLTREQQERLENKRKRDWPY